MNNSKSIPALSHKNGEAKNKQALLLMIVVILVTLFVLLILYLIQENFGKIPVKCI